MGHYASEMGDSSEPLPDAVWPPGGLSLTEFAVLRDPQPTQYGNYRCALLGGGVVLHTAYLEPHVTPTHAFRKLLKAWLR